MAEKIQNSIAKNQKVLEPLNFCANENEQIYQKLFPIEIEVVCLFCDKAFKFNLEKHAYLAHLYLEHRLIIGDEDQVPIFHEYLAHWREIFLKQDFKLFCTKITMDQLPDGTPSKNEIYFLLCDVSTEDNELRQNLQRKRLELALEQHKLERTDDTYERNCLFCRDIVTGTRRNFIEHLFSKHFLQLGKPDNLVFIDQLIDTVHNKLDTLICLFCEKKFKDRPTLKEHMRKKGHKRINPENQNYDLFFLIFYQKQPQQFQKTKKTDEKLPDKMHYYRDSEAALLEDDNDDSNWSDWEGEAVEVTCLYCPYKDTDFPKLKNHMTVEHKIDFDKETVTMSFYDRVKIVNFVRRKMFVKECLTCDEVFSNRSDLLKHLNQQSHYSLGKPDDWNLPQYFFPTYEDDAFLCFLDDENSSTKETIILSEDQEIKINLDAEALSIEQLSSVVL